MKIVAVLPDPGRTVAYHPRLRWLCGSINAALFLDQLIYWTGKQSDPDGWIYKSAEEITLEIGLTYAEQKTARAKLRLRGFLQEHYRRSDHTFYFRVNLEALRAAASGTATCNSPGLERKVPGNPNDGSVRRRTSESDVPEHAMPAFPKVGIQRSRSADPCIPESENSAFPNEGSTRSIKCTSTEYAKNTLKITNESAAQNAKGVNNSQRIPDPPTSEPQLEKERLTNDATAAFESALRVKGWPWSDSDDWKKLAGFITEAWKEDQQAFREYAEWMEGEGRFRSMNVKQIRISPLQFIDTGWPLYLASRKPKESEPMQVESDLERRLREGIGVK